MKNNYLILIQLSFLFLLFSCDSGEETLIFNADRESYSITVWQVTKAMVETSSHGFDDRKIFAEGNLSYIIKNSYSEEDAALDISKFESGSSRYKFEVVANQGGSVDDVVNEALALWLNDLGKEVFYGSKARNVYLLTVSDKEKLFSHAYESQNGVTQNKALINKKLTVKGDLKEFVEEFEKNALDAPLIVEFDTALLAKQFSISVEWNNGLKQAKEMLMITYGLELTEDSRNIKVLEIQ